jgi:phosphoglycolate phosphatase
LRLTVEAILFDLDGTLIDSKKDLALSIHQLQKTYGCPPSSDAEIARFIGDGVVKLVERAIGPREPAELERAVELFKAHYRLHALDHTTAYPAVAETLAHFEKKKLAVVTNKPVRISIRILEGLGLGGFFPVVVGGDSASRKKPHPEPILQAIRLLGSPNPRKVLIVGDGFQDVVAGRAAGILTCGIPSRIGDRALLAKSEPDFTARSIQELTRIIN